MRRSNNCPMSDVCKLRKLNRAYDTSRHYTENPTDREVFCSISDGVTRAEFYEAYKAGMQLSATVEVYEDDYEGEEQLVYEGNLYNIIRTYPTGYGTLELSLQEVLR